MNKKTIDDLIDIHVPEIKIIMEAEQELVYIKSLTKLYTPKGVKAHDYYFKLQTMAVNIYEKCHKILPEDQSRFEALLLITKYAIENQ